MSKFEIELPPALSDYLEDQVEAGLFKSVSDAVEHAVRRDYDGEDVRLDVLRAALAPGLADIAAGRSRELTIEEILANARASVRGRG